MGIISSLFNKAGNWHIKQLVKGSCDRIIQATTQGLRQKGNPHLVDDALDLLIDTDRIMTMKKKTYDSLTGKLRDYMSFYVVTKVSQESFVITCRSMWSQT